VVSTPLKNISQWEGLSHILWKIKHVPNHQAGKLVFLFVKKGHIGVSEEKNNIHPSNMPIKWGIWTYDHLQNGDTLLQTLLTNEQL
jgi:hypothetical protein